MTKLKYNPSRKSGLDLTGNSSGGTSVPDPPVSGQGELISNEGTVEWDTRPYTVDPGTDIARFKDDVYVDGEVYAQSQSVFIGGGLKIGASNYTPLINTEDNVDQFVIPLGSQGSGLTSSPRYVDSYELWDKNSDTGQFQPNQTTTLDSTINPNFDASDPRNPRNGYQHTFSIVVQASGDLRVLNWYLRSATGFDNYYVKMYQGVVSNPTITQLPLWQSHTDKQIRNGQCFTHGADTVNDIQFNLRNTYYQADQQVYSFVGYAESAFQFEAAELNVPTFPPIDYPYVVADGYFLYNRLVENLPLVVGTTENIEGFQNMNDGEVSGILKYVSNTDLNYTDFYIGQNGMINPGQSGKLRVAIYNTTDGGLINQGEYTIDNSIPDYSFIRVPHTSIHEYLGETVFICVASNDYTSGGGFTLARTRAQNVNRDEVLFLAELPSGAFPSNISSLTNRRNGTFSINSFSNLDLNIVIPQQTAFQIPTS